MTSTSSGPNGVRPSGLAIFSHSTSLSMVRLATTDFNRRVSTFSTASSRLFRPASPQARNCSCQSVSVGAVTRYFRDVLSRSAPRSNSRTTAQFRCSDQRLAPARPDKPSQDSCLFSLESSNHVSNILSVTCSQRSAHINRGTGRLSLDQSPGEWP